MKKLTRKSLGELAAKMPILTQEEMVSFIAGTGTLPPNDIYQFTGSVMAGGLIPGVGLLGRMKVNGYATYGTDGNINVGGCAESNVSGLSYSANVKVYRDGKLYHSQNFAHHPSGEIYPTGTVSLGGASITLPSSGTIEVEVNVTGLYNSGTGNVAFNYSKSIPIYAPIVTGVSNNY